ncbi:unnamed protein product [Malus baccata var. baccata]
MDKDYKNAWWRHHGEKNIGEQNVAIGEEETGDEVAGMHDFLNDVFVQPLTEEGVGSSTELPIGERRPEEVETFFRLLEKADQDLWPGCKEFKKLEAVVRLYQIKCLAGMPDEIFTTLLELIKRMLPEGDCLPESYYKAKKLINDLGLTYVKIDACPNDCMIYWKDTSELIVCSVCGESRYKITYAEDRLRKKITAKLCSKKEYEEGFKQLYSRIALTLCQLEKIFPPALFDIMVHLPVHLADEATLVRPVQYRWMYPIERYLQTLKCYVRNKGHPESFIVEAYLVDECLSFYSMYLRDVKSRRIRRGRNEDGIGRGVSDLHWLANYPSMVVSRYKSHIIHGFKFRIKSVDDKHKNQNCGVFVPANVPGAIGQVNCYGKVVDMFEVKYCVHTELGDRGRAVMLFKYEWVNSESPRGMKTNQYGFTMGNFNRLGFKEDPFILSSQEVQAFYVDDTIEKDWHVVVRTQPRDLFDVLENSDTIEDYAIPNLDDQILDHENFHTRVGVEETHFHESLPLPTQFVSNANANDDTTYDDME